MTVTVWPWGRDVQIHPPRMEVCGQACSMRLMRGGFIFRNHCGHPIAKNKSECIERIERTATRLAQATEHAQNILYSMRKKNKTWFPNQTQSHPEVYHTWMGSFFFNSNKSTNCLFTSLVNFFTTCLDELLYLHCYIIYSSVTGSFNLNLTKYSCGGI